MLVCLKLKGLVVTFGAPSRAARLGPGADEGTGLWLILVGAADPPYHLG